MPSPIRFQLRSLVWVITLLAVCVGWSADRSRLRARYNTLTINQSRAIARLLNEVNSKKNELRMMQDEVKRLRDKLARVGRTPQQ